MYFWDLPIRNLNKNMKDMLQISVPQTRDFSSGKLDNHLRRKICFRGDRLQWQLGGGPGPPLWKIWTSIGMMKFPIHGKIKNGNRTTNQGNHDYRGGYGSGFPNANLLVLVYLPLITGWFSKLGFLWCRYINIPAPWWAYLGLDGALFWCDQIARSSREDSSHQTAAGKNPLPMTDPSWYAIHGNIYHQYTPNVSIYTIHTDPMGCKSTVECENLRTRGRCSSKACLNPSFGNP